MGLALCTRGTLGKYTGTLGSKSTGTLGKGTLRTYPPSMVPTEALTKVFANRPDLVIKHKKYLDMLKWDVIEQKQ